MGKRDDRYRLEDMVEYDEAFVGKSPKAQVRSKLKRGSGLKNSQKWLLWPNQQCWKTLSRERLTRVVDTSK
jgi:hypothetical protein